MHQSDLFNAADLNSSGRGQPIESAESEIAKIKRRHNVGRASIPPQVKPKLDRKVRYVFPEDLAREAAQAREQEEREKAAAEQAERDNAIKALN